MSNLKFPRYDSEHHLRTNNYGWFLFSLSVMLFFPAFGVVFQSLTGLIFNIGFSFVIFFGVYTVTHTKRELRIGIVLGVLTLLGFWGEQAIEIILPWFGYLRIMVSVLYFGFIGYEISRQIILTKGKVTINLVYGAIVGFLIIGILGGQLSMLFDMLVPGSFFEYFDPKKSYQYYYYSFITLCSVGYGEIVPGTDPARALSLVIALTGQIYMTIVIAIIIGKFMVQSVEE